MAVGQGAVGGVLGTDSSLSEIPRLIVLATGRTVCVWRVRGLEAGMDGSGVRCEALVTVETSQLQRRTTSPIFCAEDTGGGHSKPRSSDDVRRSGDRGFVTDDVAPLLCAKAVLDCQSILGASGVPPHMGLILVDVRGRIWSTTVELQMTVCVCARARACV